MPLKTVSRLVMLITINTRPNGQLLINILLHFYKIFIKSYIMVRLICVDFCNVVYVPKDHYSAINLYDPGSLKRNLISIEKFNYLGQPSHPYELS